MKLLIALAMSAVLIAPAGAGTETEPVPAAPVRIAGSSTLAPFSRAVAETLEVRRGTPFVLHQTGTGAGIGVFCDGVSGIDIVNASRRIRPGEIERCRESGIDGLLEFPVGRDGIVLAQSSRQKPMRLSLVDLYYALAEETPVAADDCRMERNRRRTWHDANPALPRRRLEVFGPPHTSGTRDSFIELALVQGARQVPCIRAALDRDPAAPEGMVRLREDGIWIDAGENDDAMAAALAHIETAVGVIGFSHVRRGGHAIEALSIDGITPSEATIGDGTYPLSREMWFYVSADAYDSSDYLHVYVDEFRDDDAIGAHGYLTQLGLVQSNDGAGVDGRRLRH